MRNLKNCITNFIFHCTYEKNLSEKTIKAYRIDLNQFESHISALGIADDIHMDKEIIRNYIKVISVQNKPKTLKRKVATLKTFFTYLEFEEIISINPFRKIKLSIKEGKRLPKTITLLTIIQLFKYLYGIRAQMSLKQTYADRAVIRDIAVLELLFSAGLRVAELCTLSKKNIDVVNGSLRIIGKGNKERIIPICNKETLQALASYSEAFQEVIANAPYFFVNRLNNRLSEQSVRFMLKKYSTKMQLAENITPHMFRHSIATLLLERGVDIRYIQTFLGHSSITTTQIYVQVNEAAQRNVLLNKHPRQMFSVLFNEG